MRLRSGCRLWFIVLPVLLLDRLTKHYATWLHAQKAARSVLPGVVSFVYTENRGAAFSLLRGRSLLLILLTLALSAGVLVYLIRRPAMPTMERIGFWCILGGGLGNLFDRAMQGYVVDFIRLDFVRFAIFNVADIFVCLGAAMIVLSACLSDRRKTHAQ